MVTLFVLGTSFGLLFLLPFLMKRRFGLLGLALAAGALLSAYLTEAVQAFLESQDITLGQPPLASVVAVSLVLFPAMLVLFGSPSSSGKTQRIVSSLLFASMAFLIILPELQNIFVIDPAAMPVLETVAKYKSTALAALIIYATIDTALGQGRPGKPASRK